MQRKLSPQEPSSPSSSSNGLASSENLCTHSLSTCKRQKLVFSSSESIADDTGEAAHYLLYEFPAKVLLNIFSNLLEQDLCRVAQVCKRFHIVSSNTELWKTLYQNVYEYDLPLFNPAPTKFEFVPIEECKYDNPWKESFKQLYRGLHVRPGYQEHHESNPELYRGRNLLYLDTIESAFNYSEENDCPLIFIHAGVYKGEFLIIDTNIAMIGASHGNVAENVILDNDTMTTVTYVEGAIQSYLGYLTLKFTPDASSSVPHHKHYCLEVGENCSPTIDHCVIRSASVVSAAVCVTGEGAEPTIKYCDISDCENVGLYITDHAQGIYQKNKMRRNPWYLFAGAWVNNITNPMMRRNHIHHGRGVNFR